MKETFPTRLDEHEAQWVERQAIVFGSYSLVIRTCVRVVMALIADGSLRFELLSLQELLRCNPRNRQGCFEFEEPTASQAGSGRTARKIAKVRLIRPCGDAELEAREGGRLRRTLFSGHARSVAYSSSGCGGHGGQGGMAITPFRIAFESHACAEIVA